jgi:hypothetical protein
LIISERIRQLQERFAASLREERSWPTQTIVTEPVRRVQVGQFDQPLDRVEYLLRNCGYLAERKGDCVVLSDNAHWLDFRDLDVADLLYQKRIRLREIRREIALQMDARAEQFAFEVSC